MTEQVDVSRARAELVARTEIMRAHAEGQLTALEQLGVEDVGVAVEWKTSGRYDVDKYGRPISPCELCIPMEGIILKIDEARNMLPRHPGCLCCWIPANVGEDDKDQKDTKEEIDAAMEESGLDKEVDDERPESILGNVSTHPNIHVGNVNPHHDELGRFASGGEKAVTPTSYTKEIPLHLGPHKYIRGQE